MIIWCVYFNNKGCDNVALVRPSLPSMTIMDAGYDTLITFDVYGGDQYTGYYIEIYNNETNILHYSASKTTYSNQYNIEANVLANGVDYRFRVRTLLGDDYSEYSDFMLLKCYTKPVCTIDNLNIVDNKRTVSAQNYIFEGSYFQAENVAIKSYQYLLYDQDKNLIQEFDKVFTSESELNQKVEGFTPSTEYYIELLCVDQYDLEVTSGLVNFIVEYEAPRITQVVDLENDKETASVKISSSMIQILFKSENETPVYINEQEIDLRENKIYLDERINLVGNFTLKMYCRAIPSVDIGAEDYFLTLTSVDERTTIKLKESEGRIHVYKIQKPRPSGADVVGHYASQVIENYIPNESYVVIQINHINRRFDIYAQVTEMVA